MNLSTDLVIFNAVLTKFQAVGKNTLTQSKFSGKGQEQTLKVIHVKCVGLIPVSTLDQVEKVCTWSEVGQIKQALDVVIDCLQEGKS